MPARIFYSLLAVLGTATQVAQAQLTSDCNPLVSGNCPPKPGWPDKNYHVDFTKATSLPPHWIMADGKPVRFQSQGAEFTFNHKGDAPQLWTDFYILGGRYDVDMKIAPGVGIISSAVLWSDSLDEIDWEFSGNQFGNQPFPSADGMYTIQTNIFGQGQSWGSAPTFEKWVHKPYDEFHKYSVEWDADYIRWYVDDKLKREVHPKDVSAGSKMPQGPMKLQLGLWDGGDPDNSYWTKQWAGGETDLQGGPYTAYVRSVNITNKYPACQFMYNGKSGMRDSIQVITTGCSTPSTAGATTKPLSGSPPGLKVMKDQIPGGPIYGVSGISTSPLSPISSAVSSLHPASSPGPAPVSSGGYKANPPPSLPGSSVATPPVSPSSAPKVLSSSSALAPGPSPVSSGGYKVSPLPSSPGRSVATTPAPSSSTAPVSPGGYSVKPASFSSTESSAAKLSASVPSPASSGSDRVSPASSSSHTSLAATPPASAPASVPPGGYRVNPAPPSAVPSSLASVAPGSSVASSRPSPSPSTSSGGYAVTSILSSTVSALSSTIMGQSSSFSSGISTSSAPLSTPLTSTGGFLSSISSYILGSNTPLSAPSGSALSSLLSTGSSQASSAVASLSSVYDVSSTPPSSLSTSPPASLTTRPAPFSSQPLSSTPSVLSSPASIALSGSSATGPVGASLITTSSVSTIYSTNIYTVTSCAPGVQDCPGKGAVTTELISVSTTICPVTLTAGVPVAPAIEPRISSDPEDSSVTQASGVPSASGVSSQLASTSSVLASGIVSASSSLSSAISTFSSSTVTVSPISVAPSSETSSATPTLDLPTTYSVSSEVTTTSISTVFSTNVYTVTSCGPSVTDCPGIGAVTTELVSLYTTICPVTLPVLDGVTYTVTPQPTPTLAPSEVLSVAPSMSSLAPSSSTPSFGDVPEDAHKGLGPSSVEPSSSLVATAPSSAAAISKTLAIPSGSSSSKSPVFTTSTVYSTNVYTVTSCAPEATNCPAKLGAVTTEIVAVSTAVCPVTESPLPAAAEISPVEGAVYSTQVVTITNTEGATPVVVTTPITFIDTPVPTLAVPSGFSAPADASAGPFPNTSKPCTTLTLSNFFTTVIEYEALTSSPPATPVPQPGGVLMDVPSYKFSGTSLTAAMASPPPVVANSSPSPVEVVQTSNGVTTRVTRTLTNHQTINATQPADAPVIAPFGGAGPGNAPPLCEPSVVTVTVTVTATPACPSAVTVTIEPPFPSSLAGSGTVGGTGGLPSRSGGESSSTGTEPSREVDMDMGSSMAATPTPVTRQWFRRGDHIHGHMQRRNHHH